MEQRLEQGGAKGHVHAPEDYTLSPNPLPPIARDIAPRVRPIAMRHRQQSLNA